MYFETIRTNEYAPIIIIFAEIRTCVKNGKKNIVKIAVNKFVMYVL